MLTVNLGEMEIGSILVNGTVGEENVHSAEVNALLLELFSKVSGVDTSVAKSEGPERRQRGQIKCVLFEVEIAESQGVERAWQLV